MDDIHERLFNAYAYLCATIGAQLDLLAQDNNPEVQIQRARIINELAQGVSTLAHPVQMAIDAMYEHYPLTTVSADEEAI